MLNILEIIGALQRDPDRRARVTRKSQQCGLATTLALVAAGWVESRDPFGPLNAVSHITWGDEALEQHGFSGKYTLTGAFLNASSVGGWATLHDLLCNRAEAEGDTLIPIAGAIGVALLAWIVDYKVVPRRLQPGFESRVSPRAMGIIYGALAIALAWNALANGVSKAKR